MGELELKARRAWRRTTLLALIGAVVGAVIGGLLATTESGAVAVLTVVGFGASVGGLAGTFSILATTIGMSTAMQTTTAGLSPCRQAHGDASDQDRQPDPATRVRPRPPSTRARTTALHLPATRPRPVPAALRRHRRHPVPEARGRRCLRLGVHPVPLRSATHHRTDHDADPAASGSSVAAVPARGDRRGFPRSRGPDEDGRPHNQSASEPHDSAARPDSRCANRNRNRNRNRNH
ncbi:hypothetical protein Q9Q99_00195 [Curtobacterium flaccumfaciens]|nr:hypothetical protein Q9Q99_00195 [Curtobacterium flaccumfaciens]